jgi:hypothetical protein
MGADTGQDGGVDPMDTTATDAHPHAGTGALTNLVVSQIGEDQSGYFDFYRREVAPRLQL